jgi:hypothetical protein
LFAQQPIFVVLHRAPSKRSIQQGEVKRRVGNYRWGVYIFYDYDSEPIYVGQTNEMLRTRIRRHLTNQRTDAVAMSVSDPFEVYEIEVYPLPQFQDVSGAADRAAARAHLNALEHAVYGKATRRQPVQGHPQRKRSVGADRGS